MTKIETKIDCAILNCADAVAFFDKVKMATEDEKVAVGHDHWKMIERAVRYAASLRPAVRFATFDNTGCPHFFVRQENGSEECMNINEIVHSFYWAATELHDMANHAVAA